MPQNTTDQQITVPIGVDTADNPLAFMDMIVDVQPRLVREYTTEADRTTRMAVLATNDISSLSTPAVGIPRVEIYDGSNHVSLYKRSVFAMARKTGTQNVGPSNTVLQNVTDMAIALPAINGAIYQFRGWVFYNSNVTADIKFALTIPTSATMTWGMHGLATSAGSSVGDMTAATTNTSGTALSLGGGAVDTVASFWGEITMNVNAGNLQLQAAQNTSDASTSNILPRSFIELWRFS